MQHFFFLYGSKIIWTIKLHKHFKEHMKHLKSRATLSEMKGCPWSR